MADPSGVIAAGGEIFADALGQGPAFGPPPAYVGRFLLIGAEVTAWTAGTVAVMYYLDTKLNGGELFANEANRALGVTEIHTGQLKPSKKVKPHKLKTLQPGPFAGESIPARGPERDFKAEEREKIDDIGRRTGCHTCGSKLPGTVTGHFVPDHQPPNALNASGGPQRLYPHCLNCSKQQGLDVAGWNNRK